MDAPDRPVMGLRTLKGVIWIAGGGGGSGFMHLSKLKNQTPYTGVEVVEETVNYQGD